MSPCIQPRGIDRPCGSICKEYRESSDTWVHLLHTRGGGDIDNSRVKISIRFSLCGVTNRRLVPSARIECCLSEGFPTFRGFLLKFILTTHHLRYQQTFSRPAVRIWEGSLAVRLFNRVSRGTASGNRHGRPRDCTRYCCNPRSPRDEDRRLTSPSQIRLPETPPEVCRTSEI